ncbi:MAG TPA: PAS domain S-box protein, partial [Vicinamibacteria bacterium]
MTRGFLDGRLRLAAAPLTLLALLGAQAAWAPQASPTLWLLLGCLFGAALAWRRSPHDDRATAESFRHLIENAPDFVTLTDANGQVRFRSAALQHFLGPQAEGLRKAPVHPEDVPKDAALFAEALSTPGAVRIADLRVRRRDGEWRSLEVVVRNLLHEPQVRGLLVYSRDVTDRKRAEVRQELRVQAARLLSTSARVSEAMPRLLRLLCEGLGLAAGAAILPGPDGAKTFTWPSEAGPAADTLRLAREVALGGDTWAAGAVAVPIRVASGLLGAQAFSTQGRSVLEPGLLELLSELGLQVGQLLARDRAEETLRRREDRFRALVEDSADGIALFDAEGRIQWTGANTAILGYDRHEVEGRRVADLVHHEDLQRLEAFFDEVPGDPSRFVTVQFRLQHKDGSWRWLEGSLRNLLQNPAVRGVVANYRDVTLQRRLQDDLVRAAAEWRLTFDAIASPVLVVRPPSTLVRLNDAGQALAGRAFDALVGHDLVELGEGEPWRTAAVLAQQVGV